MSTERRRETIEAALRRRTQPSRATRERIERAFAEAERLHTDCQRCGARRYGTLEELRQPHGCGDGG